MRQELRRARGMRSALWIVITVISLALAGCATGATSTPAATVGPTRAAAETTPAATDAATQAAPATTEVAATAEATAAGTVAVAPTQAVTPTVAATPTVEVTPTLAARATAAPPAPTETPAAAGSVALGELAVTLAPFAEGFANPLFLTHAGDGNNRLFVVEKPGAIRIIADGQTLPQPFLDITGRVGSSGSEQGLLGLAFPPDYATRKFFFVNYTDRNGDTVVARFNVGADPNVADPGSEFVVLKLDQPAANHNGGDLAFGPDGMLWIGTGDGGAANDRFGNGQNAQTLLGKMLRLDVTSDPNSPYLVPQDNPWANGQEARPELWAIGLRNPWRYSFDRQTGDLWIADVGQNLIEEVNVVRAPLAGGLNFGWPIQEGRDCFSQQNCDPAGLVQPVAQYNHGPDGCSVTGGYVYRGSQFPSLVGAYIYGDYCSGRIWGLDAANPGAPVLLANAGPGLSSFGEDEAGELYITDLAKGVIRRIATQ